MLEGEFTTKDIRALRVELRRVRDQMPDAMKEGLNEAVGPFVAKVKPLVPRRTGAAQGSIKPASTKTAARIKVGGNDAPYYQWLDFGGRVGRGKSVVRPFVKEGRYLYPTLRKERQNIIRAVDKVVTELGKQLGDVGGTV